MVRGQASGARACFPCAKGNAKEQGTFEVRETIRIAQQLLQRHSGYGIGADKLKDRDEEVLVPVNLAEPAGLEILEEVRAEVPDSKVAQSRLDLAVRSSGDCVQEEVVELQRRTHQFADEDAGRQAGLLGQTEHPHPDGSVLGGGADLHELQYVGDTVEGLARIVHMAVPLS